MYCSVLSASVHVGIINHNTEGLPGVRHSLHCPCFFFMLFSHAVFTDHLFFPSLLHWTVSPGLQALLSQKSKLSADRLPPLRALDRDCIKRGVSAGSHCSDSPSTAKEAHKEKRKGKLIRKKAMARDYPAGSDPSAPHRAMLQQEEPLWYHTPTPAPSAGDQHVLHSLH